MACSSMLSDMLRLFLPSSPFSGDVPVPVSVAVVMELSVSVDDGASATSIHEL